VFVILYAGAVIIAMAFAWYIFYAMYSAVSAADIITTSGTNSTTSDAVIIFFDNLGNYLLIIGLILVAVWAWVYSQKRGVYVGED
jgi:hypothetical protein